MCACPLRHHLNHRDAMRSLGRPCRVLVGRFAANLAVCFSQINGINVRSYRHEEVVRSPDALFLFSMPFSKTSNLVIIICCTNKESKGKKRNQVFCVLLAFKIAQDALLAGRVSQDHRSPSGRSTPCLFSPIHRGRNQWQKKKLFQASYINFPQPQVQVLRNAGEEVTLTVSFLKKTPAFLKLPLCEDCTCKEPHVLSLE